MNKQSLKYIGQINTNHKLPYEMYLKTLEYKNSLKKSEKKEKEESSKPIENSKPMECPDKLFIKPQVSFTYKSTNIVVTQLSKIKTGTMVVFNLQQQTKPFYVTFILINWLKKTFKTIDNKVIIHI